MADYGSPEFTRSMGMLALGDILKGGNGGSFVDYMAGQQQMAAQQEAQRQQQALAAQQAAQDAAGRQTAAGMMADVFRAQMPQAVVPFDRMAPASIAADTMAALGKIPGLPAGSAQAAAQTNSPMASAMNKMFYDMPQDVRANTQLSPTQSGGVFGYGTQGAQQWARQNAPRYGFGFQGRTPDATFGAAQSMPAQIDPARAAEIMQSPYVDPSIKKMVLEQMTGGGKPGFRPASAEEAARYGARAGQIEDSTGRFYPIESKGSFRPATPEEAAKYGAAAGQIEDSTGRFYPTPAPTGMKIDSDGKGGFTFVQGAGVKGEQKSGSDTFFSPGAFIDQIDSVLNDPALDWSTGILSWTQGMPGTPMRRFGAKSDQLLGQAFMQAREALKGAGTLTDYEGSQGEAAIGRLDTAQRPDDYRAALKDLRDLLVTAMQRPEGWINTDVGSIYTMDAGDISGMLSDARNGGTPLTEEQKAAVRARLEQIRDRQGG